MQSHYFSFIQLEQQGLWEHTAVTPPELWPEQELLVYLAALAPLLG